MSKVNKLTMTDSDGKIIGTIDIDNKTEIDDIKKKLYPTKKRVKNAIRKYVNITNVEAIDNDTCILFTFNNNMKFTFNLITCKICHQDGSEFLKTHYDRIIASIDHTVHIADGWVKRFLAYVEMVGHDLCSITSRTEKLGTYLYKFQNSICIGQVERLAKSGILGDRGTTSSNRYLGYGIDWKAPTIHEMLGVDKWFISNFREDRINSETIQNYRRSIEHTGTCESFKRAYIKYGYTLTYRHLGLITELISTYNLDWKLLTDYIFQELPLQGEQSDDGLTMLRDYIKMSRAMDQEYTQYPKYLATLHNAASHKYKLQIDKYLQRQYEQHIERINANKYEFSPRKGDYCIVVPSSIIQIQEEGKILNHCVSSYIERVLDGQCMILFMRKKDSKKTPLITIEVVRDNISQAKGKRNRRPDQNEELFLSSYKSYLKQKIKG